jgi:transposase
MGRTRTDEFRKDAMRIALTSGLTRKQVADDLGVGMSTLNVQNGSSRPQRVLSEETDLRWAGRWPGIVR